MKLRNSKYVSHHDLRPELRVKLNETITSWDGGIRYEKGEHVIVRAVGVDTIMVYGSAVVDWNRRIYCTLRELQLGMGSAKSEKV
jgi:hypothetical protein